MSGYTTREKPGKDDDDDDDEEEEEEEEDVSFWPQMLIQQQTGPLQLRRLQQQRAGDRTSCHVLRVTASAGSKQQDTHLSSL
ncbi:unnamed protein product [Lampetra planeri]